MDPKTKKSNLKHARLAENIFTFTDNLIAINYGGLVEKSYVEIYPPELELKKESKNNKETTFLDLHFKIINNKFQISLYDKSCLFCQFRNCHNVRIIYIKIAIDLVTETSDLVSY